MSAAFPLWRLALNSALLVLLAFGLAACSSFQAPTISKLVPFIKKPAEGRVTESPAKSKEQAKLEAEMARIEAEANAQEAQAPATTGSNTDLLFLLSMNFEEAKAISAQSVEMPMGVRIAADSIEVLSEDGDQKPSKVRAKGRVYLENGVGTDQAKVLCQEAYISSWEIVLRGKPIIQRGGSTIEGLEDRTVAYMLGARLRVIGMHRLSNKETMLAMLPDLGPWTGGPNPILPPLDEGSVPDDIRSQMLKAAEAEAVLQQTRVDAMKQPAAPPAPWVNSDARAASKKNIDPPAKKSGKIDDNKETPSPKANPATPGPEKPKAPNKA